MVGHPISTDNNFFFIRRSRSREIKFERNLDRPMKKKMLSVLMGGPPFTNCVIIVAVLCVLYVLIPLCIIESVTVRGRVLECELWRGPACICGKLFFKYL
jgi:hypothetical protein